MEFVALGVLVGVVVAPDRSVVERFRWIGHERAVVKRVAPTRGIRPEDLDIVDSATGGLNDESDASGASGVEGAGGADGTMDATVTVVEPTGNVTVFSIDIGSQVLTASTADSLDVDRGAWITVGMAEENVHLFDRETGAALSPSAATQAEEAPARGSSSS